MAVTLRVTLRGETRLTTIDNPIGLSGWGAGRWILIHAVGWAFSGPGRSWEIAPSVRFYFDQEGDNGIWEATVDRSGERPMVVKVQDMSFEQPVIV